MCLCSGINNTSLTGNIIPSNLTPPMLLKCLFRSESYYNRKYNVRPVFVLCEGGIFNSSRHPRRNNTLAKDFRREDVLNGKFHYLNVQKISVISIMATPRTKFNDIDSYVASFPKETQNLLEQVRSTIRKAAPQAEETINYGIPTFTLKGNLVHFAAYKNHIGFYPAASGIEAFKKDLSAYEGAKGSVKFPLDKPIPFELISRIVKFRVKENLEKANNKK